MSTSFKNYWKTGEPLVWLTAGGLGLCLLLLAALLLLIAINGTSGFWPKAVHEFQMKDNSVVLGEIFDREKDSEKIKIKQGNRDLYGLDFKWIETSEVLRSDTPENIVMVERTEWGSFYGNITALKTPEDTVNVGEDRFFELLNSKQEQTRLVLNAIKSLEEGPISEISNSQSEVILKLKNMSKDASLAERTEVEDKRVYLQAEFEQLEEERTELAQQLDSSLVLTSIDGQEKSVPLKNVLRIIEPNRLGLMQKISLYITRIYEFISEDPREANTEGGVFPAIFGTVMMVLIMSVIVTPLGVLSAVYLHEYAKPGPLVRLVRIAVNNLAGVPSIVFGVFGVGFFIYGIGGSLDQWFFSDSLPTPTFGTGGILWASLTLALLTVPTVIVATEEGLSSLPKHWREASYALGATKFETMWRVVIPALSPAILTGVILAIARAAGEVAPLMITGVVKMAPTLPLDGEFPFFHMDRKFMHLGFHIYDLGFQSPNVDASRPMVYATTLLLLLIVIGLNSVAIIVRNRLNKKIHVGTI